MAHRSICGCWFVGTNTQTRSPPASLCRFLPQTKLRADTSILVTTSRTKLYQTFLNDTGENANQVKYTFPLYDGVSVVSFKCTINGTVILGIVKEREEARVEYENAVAQGKAAGLLEQSLDASDVFTTSVGNIPDGAQAEIEIEYIGELKHDAELDGVRFTIPTSIAPRYDARSKNSSWLPSILNPFKSLSATAGTIDISVDVVMEEGANIEGLTSPSHPIAMKLGRTSTQTDQFRSHLANATLALGSAELSKDFVIVVHAQGHEIPRALLERHPTIHNHQALMTTLVPKFNLPTSSTEIVFIVDRSGSMHDKMALVNEALKLFLRSLPYSAKFNIISFGSSYQALFPKSVAYDQQTAQKALEAVQGFAANFGGTEMLSPLQAAVENRLPGVSLEIMLLTDGQVWNQQPMFDFINDAAKNNVRLFSLGIGDGASTSQVEGLARAGNGFAQFAKNGEKIDKRLMRMLKAALSPHINDYHLEVTYSDLVPSEKGSSGDEDFEMIGDVTMPDRTVKKADSNQPAPVISLIDANFTESAPNAGSKRYTHLPTIKVPQELQAPYEIGGLFSFNRTSVYLLLADSHKKVQSVALVGSFNGTPLRLDIPVQDVGFGRTIHQLAAKKAMLETEEGRGWLSSTTSAEVKTLKTKHKADWDKITEREAARLGTQFQVAGKFCSFVAVEKDSDGEETLVGESIPSKQDPEPEAVSSRRISMVAPAPRQMLASMAPSHGPNIRREIKRKSKAYSPPQHRMQLQQQQTQKMQTAQAQSAFGSAPVYLSTPSPGHSPASPSFSGSGYSPVSSSYASPSYSPASPSFTPPPPPSGPVRSSAESQAVAAFGSPDIQMEMESGFDEQKKESMSALTNEKRKRNPGASARFRARRMEIDSSIFPGANHPPTQGESEDQMHNLVGLQCFDGSWQPTDQLLKLVDTKKKRFMDTDIGHDNETVKATVLALAWLEKKKSADKEIWEMIADKAKNWLAAQQGVDAVDELLKRGVEVFFP